MMPAAGNADYEAYNEWMHYSEGSAMLPLMLNLYVSRLKEAGAPLHPRIDSELANHLGYVDGALKGREFFVGASLTGADIQMSFVGEMAKVFGKLEPYPTDACPPGVPAEHRKRRGVPVCVRGGTRPSLFPSCPAMTKSRAGATVGEGLDSHPLHPHHILHKYQPDTASAWPIPADVVSRRHFFRPPHIADRLAPKGLRRWRYFAQ
jgi:hypothetical protein